MRLFVFLLFVLFHWSIGFSQKSARTALNKVYSNKDLKSFEGQYGSLNLLEYAYDHAIVKIFNNGNKPSSDFPSCKSSVSHFTDLGVKIQPYTQYFKTENPGEILAVKSIFQLQQELHQKSIENKQ